MSARCIPPGHIVSKVAPTLQRERSIEMPSTSVAFRLGWMLQKHGVSLVIICVNTGQHTSRNSGGVWAPWRHVMILFQQNEESCADDGINCIDMNNTIPTIIITSIPTYVFIALVLFLFSIAIWYWNRCFVYGDLWINIGGLMYQ